jgi:hypothetical protein
VHLATPVRKIHWFEMDKILAQRFSFCDFSNIVGFPKPLPSSQEWECGLPEFQGKEGEVPAEHFLYFHDFIQKRHIVHGDVQIKIFRYSLKGDALYWCRSLPIASIDSLHIFHVAFNFFCKDYFPVECLYESCCNEFSLFHEDFASHEHHICNEVFTMEEKICYEGVEVLDDIKHDGCSAEKYGIISDVFVILDVHEDQHVSFENYDVYEQMFSAVDVSLGYGIEVEVVYYSYEEDEEDIPLLELDGFDIPSHGEVVMMSIDLDQPTFSEYPNKEDDEHRFSMFLIYYDCESNSWESHEEEIKEEIKVQFISSSELRYEKPTANPCDDEKILIPGLELDVLPVFYDEDDEVFSKGKGLIFQPSR